MQAQPDTPSKGAGWGEAQGKGRGRHFLSAWNLPDVSGRCFVHFISRKPPKGSVKKGTFIFQGEGSQGSQKMSDLLRVAKREHHRSEADLEGVSGSPAHADLLPQALPAWLTPRGAWTHSSRTPCSHGLAGELVNPVSQFAHGTRLTQLSWLHQSTPGFLRKRRWLELGLEE